MLLLFDEAIETHMIEKERYHSYRVIVFGRFKPSDVAIKIRKKMNRRVEILDFEEMEPADENPPPPPPPSQDQIQAPNHNHQIPMFPTLDHDHHHHHHQMPSIFPSLAANEYRSFSSSRPGLFAVSRFPEPDMDQCSYWSYDYEFAGHTDSTYSSHNYYHY